MSLPFNGRSPAESLYLESRVAFRESDHHARAGPSTIQNSVWLMGYLGKNLFLNGKDGKTMNSDARVRWSLSKERNDPYSG